MMKEMYVPPAVTKHELLRDITANRSAHGNNGFGNGPYDGVPGNSGFPDTNRYLNR